MIVSAQVREREPPKSTIVLLDGNVKTFARASISVQRTGSWVGDTRVALGKQFL